jgi:hypothetical protein
MDKFSMPDTEVVIEQGGIYIIKNNLNLGYLLLNSFTKLGYPTLYIGKEETVPHDSKNSIVIAKTSLLDELDYKNRVSLNNPDGLLKIIKKYIKDNNHAVVMLNSIDDILYINSFKEVVRFFKDISTIVKKNHARFIVPGNLLILNEDEEQILEENFNLLNKNNYYHSCRQTYH